MNEQVNHRHYIDLTESSFKHRLCEHKSSFKTKEQTKLNRVVQEEKHWHIA